MMAPAVSAPVTKDEPTPAPAPAARGTAPEIKRRSSSPWRKVLPPAAESQRTLPPLQRPMIPRARRNVCVRFFPPLQSPTHLSAAEGREPRDGIAAEVVVVAPLVAVAGRPFDRHSQTGKTCVTHPLPLCPPNPSPAIRTRSSTRPGVVTMATPSSKLSRLLS